jgi:tetratricopeptide (TPR) repeat protein
MARRPGAYARQSAPYAAVFARRPMLGRYSTLLGLLVVMALAVTACSVPAPGKQASARTRPTTALQDYNAAQTLNAAGHCDRAIPLYLSALIKNAIYVNAYLNLGICYQIVGSFNAAIVEYDKAIAVDPTNFGLYITRAGLEAVMGNAGAASDDDAIAMRLAPPQAPSYVSIAGSFASFADFADAVTAMNKAIALAPDDPSLYEQRAGVYLQAKNYARAYHDYERAIKVAPFIASRATIYADLANVYDQQGDFDSAERAIAVAIRLNPDNAHFYVQSGNIHRDAGAAQATLALYDKALHRAGIGPDAEAAHEAKGDVLVSLGRVRQAVAEYRAALRLLTEPGSRATVKGKIKAARAGPS